MSERFDAWARQLANVSGSWQSSLVAVPVLLCLSGCSSFGIALGAGALGTVLGNLSSDTIEGKWYPGKPATDEKAIGANK